MWWWVGGPTNYLVYPNSGWSWVRLRLWLGCDNYILFHTKRHCIQERQIWLENIPLKNDSIYFEWSLSSYYNHLYMFMDFFNIQIMGGLSIYWIWNNFWGLGQAEMIRYLLCSPIGFWRIFWKKYNFIRYSIKNQIWV